MLVGFLVFLSAYTSVVGVLDAHISIANKIKPAAGKLPHERRELCRDIRNLANANASP